MTEPTTEQVDQEREGAEAVLRETFLWLSADLGNAWGKLAIKDIATALARVRIEARAAGRDEGLEAAADVAEGYDGDEIAYDIRALRGRT